MIKKYKKELREQREIRRENQKSYLGKHSSEARMGYSRNQYMIAHGKIKILNMIINDLKNL
tara:strand:+ start:186 stop:368 length:183 start_codon:yes stop_codon:yes gene_type:complete